MKTLNETYKATFSNGNTEIVSAWNELQAKQYFKRQFCKDSDGEANGITIESLEKVTNHNGSPAPTDWGKELDGIKKTTLAAYQFIKQSIINSSDMPYDMREIELADAVGVYTHVCLRWWPSEATGELRAYLKNRFREKESVWSCDAARIVEIAESVQKAIAGGTGK